MLKLRKRVVSAKSSERRAELGAEMKTILNDIVSAAERAMETGLLDKTDGRIVIEYTERLYRELYQGYEELKEADVMLKDMILTYSEEVALKVKEEVALKVKKESREEIARSMLADGLSPEIVEKYTGFSEKDLPALV